MGNVFHSWEQEFKTWFNKTFPLSHPEKGVMALGWQAAKVHTLTSKLAAMVNVNTLLLFIFLSLMGIKYWFVKPHWKIMMALKNLRLLMNCNLSISQ